MVSCDAGVMAELRNIVHKCYSGRSGPSSVFGLVWPHFLFSCAQSNTGGAFVCVSGFRNRTTTLLKYFAFGCVERFC